MAAFILAVTLGSAALGPSPASAHTPSGSWGSFHTICWGCSVDSGNIVRAWQIILWVDKATSATCFSFADGGFGSNTDRATEVWQGRMDLGVDGSVGYNTWTKAYSRLVRTPALDNAEFYAYDYRYNGRFVTFLKRKSDGAWYFYPDPPYCTNTTGFTPMNH
ncbi:hypothetical protein Rhe02_21200 [Rhizocola hellebori]|uniref:Uncharacterized protein n=1 Tax=Rhizocola hellebori TaxID=1392758 RepID=A0A8J3Q4Y1_9ACTN|nr:hypothetical protein Rhe02_21200 [Rhizocola hellebori]